MPEKTLTIHVKLCAICGKPLAADDGDTGSLSLHAASGELFGWSVHLPCLQGVLHPLAASRWQERRPPATG
jgi:hypothetical protein